MGNIVGKQFRVVASKNLKDSLADSVKEGNQAKFYLAQNNNPNEQKALENVTKVTNDDRNVLIINGNTIQGISKNDISKLDAISDTTKIFKYKGSLATKEMLLAKIPPSVEVGDVYNVESEITLNNICYPAYTNFVYIGGHENTELNWDSLGGTLQIGTYAIQRRESDSIISWRTENEMPLSEFKFMVSTDTGLYIDDDAKLALTLSSGGNITLHISTDPVTNVVTYQSVINDNYPLSSITIQVSTGLKIEDDRICLCLATGHNSGSASSNYSGSGLDISGGGLYVVLSSSANINKKFLVNRGDGISLDYTGLVNSLMADYALKIYIGSLINDVLKAQ
jgi:hypothetical protein